MFEEEFEITQEELDSAEALQVRDEMGCSCDEDPNWCPLHAF